MEYRFYILNRINSEIILTLKIKFDWVYLDYWWLKNCESISYIDGICKLQNFLCVLKLKYV